MIKVMRNLKNKMCKSVDKHPKYNCTYLTPILFSVCGIVATSKFGINQGYLGTWLAEAFKKEIHSLFCFLLASPSSPIQSPPCFPSNNSLWSKAPFRGVWRVQGELVIGARLFPSRSVAFSSPPRFMESKIHLIWLALAVVMEWIYDPRRSQLGVGRQTYFHLSLMAGTHVCIPQRISRLGCQRGTQLFTCLPRAGWLWPPGEVEAILWLNLPRVRVRRPLILQGQCLTLQEQAFNWKPEKAEIFFHITKCANMPVLGDGKTCFS